MKKILLIEDEVQFGNAISSYLELNGYEIIHAITAKEGLKLVDSIAIDIILLDLTLPDEDGLVLLRRFKAMTKVPIIVISGRNTLHDRAIGLEFGASDYICKPFLSKELLHRIENLLGEELFFNNVLSSQYLKIKTDERTIQVIITGEEIEFTSHEYNLLIIFVKNVGKVLTRQELIDQLSHIDGPESPRAIDITISRIRKKIKKVINNKDIIKTVRNVGYKFIG